MSIYNIDNFLVPKDIKPGNHIRFNLNENDSKISIGAIGMSYTKDFFKLSLINLIKKTIGNKNIKIKGKNIEFLINEDHPEEHVVYAKLMFPMLFGFTRLTRDIHNLAYISIADEWKNIPSNDLYQAMSRFVRKLQKTFNDEVKLLETLKEKNLDYKESIETGEYTLEYDNEKLEIEENIDVYRLRSFMNRNIDIRRQLEDTSVLYIEETLIPEERVERFFGKKPEEKIKFKYSRKRLPEIIQIGLNGEEITTVHFSKRSNDESTVINEW